MKITAIKAQIKREGRYSIYVDDTYAFSLSADALIDAHLTNGQELSATELAGYKKASQEDKAFNLTLAYVARRMRSEGELYDYFKRKEYAPEVANHIMQKLRKLKFVDDHEFAKRWIENRRLLKASSTKKLRLELRQKKVHDDIITEALAEDATDERHMLRELIEKKRRITRYQDKQKLLAYLARQGFSYDDIKAVLSED